MPDKSESEKTPAKRGFAKQPNQHTAGKFNWSPTARQETLVHNVMEAEVNGTSLTQAARDAGYEDPLNAIFRMRRNPHLREYVRQKCEERGLTVELLIDKVVAGLDANTVKTASHKGKIKDTRSFPDFRTRARYVEIGSEFLGISDAKEGGDGGDVTINILALPEKYGDMSSEEIMADLKRRRSLLVSGAR